MQLNLPVQEHLSRCKNLLVAGMGGGFDVFCGLPIYFELKNRGQQVHLANYSFSALNPRRYSTLSEGLVGVTADYESTDSYFPELYLAQWFREKMDTEVTVWCFEKTGVRPLLRSYLALIDHLSVDGILLVDGGVDSLLRGDETEIGSLLEDTISLCAVNELKGVPIRLMASLGFGAEQQITHAHILENIAALTSSDAYLGSCALVKQMRAYQLYESALTYVQERPDQSSSVINSSVVSAVQGHYGNFHLTDRTLGSKLWISPLMPLYWFFDSRTVAIRNLLLPSLRWSDTFNDAIRSAWKTMAVIPKRKHADIPLT